jgi:hypothetical protein
MRIRLLVTLALVTGAAPVHAAQEPARYCRLVVDTGERRVDNTAQETALPGSTRDLHIRSADVASNVRHLTAAVRLYSMESTDPTRAHQQRRYQFGFALPHSEYDRWWFEMLTGPQGYVRLYRKVTTVTSPVSTHDEVTLAGEGTAVVDTKRAEIRMTVPLSLLGSAARHRGAAVRELGASVDQVFGDSAPPGLDQPLGWFRHAISASPARAYRLGAPSCVPVGR